jgi:uncharacterized membrane protein YtjA (UPF0391 family)
MGIMPAISCAHKARKSEYFPVISLSGIYYGLLAHSSRRHGAAQRLLNHWTFRAPAAEQETIRRSLMLYYALVFFIIAIIAAAFGFGGIAAGAASIAKLLFFIFLVIFIVTLIMGLVRR